jgi:hypothetical protein
MTTIERLKKKLLSLTTDAAAAEKIIDQLISNAAADGVKYGLEQGMETEKFLLSTSPNASWCGRSDIFGDMVMMPASMLNVSPNFTEEKQRKKDKSL